MIQNAKGGALMAKSQTDLTCQIENALSGFPGMIPREQLAKFLGLSRRTLANYDGVVSGNVKGYQK